MTIEQKKPRIEYYDVLRGIGIVYMILGHVYLGDVFIKYIYAFHMPLFFYITGYFFDSNKYESFKVFLKHMLKTLILPYTVFVLICQPLHYIYTKEFSFKYFLLSYFTSNHNRIDVAGAYWFLFCLFVAELIYYHIDCYIKNSKVKFLAVFMTTMLGNFMKVDLPFCLDSAMSMIFVMYLGQCIQQSKESEMVKRIGSLKGYIVAILFGVNFVFIMMNGDINIRRNNLSNILLFWFNCILAILCHVNLAKKIVYCKNKFINELKNKLIYIGKNSIVYLTTNEIVIYVVSVCVNYIMGITEIFVGISKEIFQKSVVSIGTVVIITSVSMIANRTYLKKIFGK